MPALPVIGADHEVVLAEDSPLADDLDPELLDLFVDLTDPTRVVLEGLDPVGGQVREHDESRHLDLSLSRCLRQAQPILRDCHLAVREIDSQMGGTA